MSKRESMACWTYLFRHVMHYQSIPHEILRHSDGDVLPCLKVSLGQRFRIHWMFISKVFVQGLSWSFPLCCEAAVSYSKLIAKNMFETLFKGIGRVVLALSKTASTRRKAISISRKQALQRHKTCGTAQILSISSKRQPPRALFVEAWWQTRRGLKHGRRPTEMPWNVQAFFVVFCCCLAGFLHHFSATFRKPHCNIL